MPALSNHLPSNHPPFQAATPSPAPEAPVDPLAPIDQLLQWGVHATEQLGLGFTLGLLAAPLMRARHLHWSWAAGALALTFLARNELGSLAPTLATAALTATVRGRRWHHEDIEAGADLTDIARRRLTPLDALRVARRRVAMLDALHTVRWGMASLDAQCTVRRGIALLDALHTVRRGMASLDAQCTVRRGMASLDALRSAASRLAKIDRGELIVGEDRSSRPVHIPLRDASGGVHTLVVGSTGSGKTVTQTAIAVAAAQREMAVTVIDPKGDRHMRDELERAARIAGVDFVEWTPEGPSVYNPFANGTPTEIADRALAGERFTEPHYLRQAQRYLGNEVRVLRRAERQVSLAELAHHLDPDHLEVLTRNLPEPLESVHDYLGSLTPRQLSDLAGVRDRLTIMAESDIAPWLDPHTPGAVAFDLRQALRARAVVYFSLQADQRPLLAQMLSSAIVQDLQSVLAILQWYPVPALVAIDEFSALGAEQVWRLFGRARSAGVSLLLGTQELSDLRLPGHERMLEQILGNLSTLIAHRQVVPDSAELVARLAGTRGTWSTSRSSSGHHTRTRVREYLLHPDRISRLPRGCAAVLALTGDTPRAAGVSIARMRMPQQ